MTLTRRTMLYAGSVALALALVSPLAVGADDKPKGDPDATIEVNHSQVAVGATFGSGSGKLNFKGEMQEFEISGLGIGGVGVTEVDTTGKVYHLKNADDFYGTYSEMNIAAALGEGSTSVWMKNSNGVVVEIDTSNEGLAFTMGVEGVSFERK